LLDPPVLFVPPAALVPAVPGFAGASSSSPQAASPPVVARRPQKNRAKRRFEVVLVMVEALS
jgi:hypothetical protein